jgi:hypothetical protein
MDRRAAHNNTYPKGGFLFSKYSFEVGLSIVLQLNFCAKNPLLCQATNLYKAFQDAQQ